MFEYVAPFVDYGLLVEQISNRFGTTLSRSRIPSTIHAAASDYTCLRRGSKWSLSQSPKKFSEMTVSPMPTPGMTAIHHAVAM